MNKTEETVLCDIKVGEKCTVNRVESEDDMKRRLYDLGFVPGEKIECIIKSPLGDPKAYLVKNTLIALRCDDSRNIYVERF
ncbi:MAG: ferrous iron transport protein A [Ruminococcaceae bacterium]|nr:ferrous iron transport protein A [Oscillospiraceae bacterium]